MNPWIVSVGCIISLCGVGEGSKIIMLAAVASRSHLNVFVPLTNELASRGHDVTIVTPMKLPNVRPGVEVVVVDANRASFDKFQTASFNDSLKLSFVSHVKHIRTMMVECTEQFLRHPFVAGMLAGGGQTSYDLAVISMYLNDIAFVVSPKVAKHVVALSPGSMSNVRKLSAPLSLATFPIPMIDIGFPMSFFERVKNIAMFTVFVLGFPYATEGAVKEVTDKLLPNAPSVRESYEKASIALNNAEPVLTIAKPEVATSLNVGGMHCRTAKPVPKEFEEFIGDGDFMIFSLGSVVPGKLMSPDTRDAFVSAFRQLRIKVIWKFEETIDDLPSNVMVTPWMPQQDLLGHPKIRLFITHGGALSLQETVYHSVPVIGIPVFADQPGNVNRLVQLGAGERLNMDDISSEKVLASINKILDDESYSDNMKRQSAILRDQPERPVERAAFWVEYVIRHDGADELLMRSEHLNLAQYLSLDVIGTVLVFSVASLALAGIVLRKLAKVAVTLARRAIRKNRPTEK